MRLFTLYLLFSFTLLSSLAAQWESLGSGDLTNHDQNAIWSIHTPSEDVVWGIVLNVSDFSPNQNFIKSTDGGQTFTTGSINAEDPSLTSFSIFALDENTAWAAMTQEPIQNYGQVYKTIDGGVNWIKQLEENPPYAIVKVHFWDENEGIVIGTTTQSSGASIFEVPILKTLDGGQTWTEQVITEAGVSEGIWLGSGNGYVEVLGDQVWFGVSSGRIYKSADRGSTWNVSETLDGARMINGVAFKDELNGLAISGISDSGFFTTNKAWKTENGGMNWIEIDVPADPDFLSLEYIPQTPNSYIITGGYLGKDMAITTTGGAYWTKTKSPRMMGIYFLSPTNGFGGGRILGNGKEGMHLFTSSFSLDHTNVTTFAGSGTEGDRTGESSIAQFYNPKGIAMDADGNIYISDDYNNAIKQINPDGEVSILVSNETITEDSLTFSRPQDIIIDTEGNLLVADGNNNQVKKIALADGSLEVTILAGTGEEGLIDGLANEATFSFVTGLGQDTDGNIYVGDNNAVRKITPDGIVSTLAGSLEADFADGMGSEARFNFVWGLDVDTEGNIIVADVINCAIRKIAPDGEVTTLAGNGNPAYVDGIGSVARFSYPEDVTVDIGGNIYVADGTNSVIRKITPDGEVSTLSGMKDEDYFLGENGPEAIDGNGEFATFSRSRGIYMKPDGNLLMSEWGTDLIREIQIGTPSHPLIVTESTIEDNWGIGHIRHLNPYAFYGQVQNTSDFIQSNIKLRLKIFQNGSLRFSKNVSVLEITPGSFEGFMIEEAFMPQDTGFYEVRFEYSQDNQLFYTDYQEIYITDYSMDHGDGRAYIGGTYFDYFPDFQGGYGSLFELDVADSLSGIAAGFFLLDTTSAVQFSVYQIEEQNTSLIFSSGMVLSDAYTEDGQYQTYMLPQTIWLEAGNYLYTIEEDSVRSLLLLFDNQIISDNNRIQDFSTGEWTSLLELAGFNDLLYMIRPVFGNPPMTTAVSEPLVNQTTISVSPNPFVDNITISLAKEAPSAQMLELANLEGRKMMQFSIQPGQSIIKDLKDLPKGMYILHSRLGGQQQVLRVLKQ